LSHHKSHLASVILVLVVLIGTFWAGDALHGRVYNPFTPHSTQHVDFSSLNDLYVLMKNNFDGKIDSTTALEGAREGLVAAGGDPYTVYLDAKAAKSLSDGLTGSLSGIGAEIGIKSSYVTVIAPVDGTPAQKAGLQPGDIIVKINKEDTTGMSVDTAVSKIRGKKDTQVTLTLVRGTTNPAFDVTITRADIVVPSVKWSMKEGNIGYIQLARFGPDTAQLTDKAATELKAQGATKIILDLRNNGGGYLDAGVAVASEFLPEGKLVVEERTDGKSRDKLNSTGAGKLVGLPLQILVNGGSASASEIVAGALHDNGVAKLIGEKTFGKGSVQEIKQLPGGAEFKVTIAHWFTPHGININKEGIKPDSEVKLTTEDFNASRDPQLEAAIAALK
ncbi:MAG: S41 family peptidase, partial [Candidatus Saccharibacteria bacterium]